MRLLVMGNSGSGKSTYAARRAAEADVPCLELDSLVWEPGRIAVERPVEAARADLFAFLGAHPGWVIEGCDGDRIEDALPACTELVFLNPGVAACLENNRRRPWEPHKYARAEDQERMLPALLAWVESYARRSDARSYVFHRRVFDGFRGAKREIVDLQELG